MKSVRLFSYFICFLRGRFQFITFNLFSKSGAKVGKQIESPNKSLNNLSSFIKSNLFSIR